MQHRQYLEWNDDYRHPRTAMLEDLFKEITTWKLLGNQIVMMMDVNEDVRRGDTDNLFQFLGMTEVILCRHSSKSPPATYNRNNNRDPIARIWITSMLPCRARGYFPFKGEAQSDHRLLFIEIEASNAFGNQPGEPVRLAARRL
jgi:hypothetical protein